MLWDKTKYHISLIGGSGAIETTAMHGIIQQFLVIPDSEDTVWSVRLIDNENDVIYEELDHVGRLDDKSGIPVGKDDPQKLKVHIFDSTLNESFNIMFKVREVK